MESILTLDRLRQSVAVKELEQVRGPTLSMRKTASVPNFSQMRFFDASLESLMGIGRSESYADLKVGLNSAQSTRESTVSRQKLKSPSSSGEDTNNSYGLASPAASKLAQRMTTLHEEPLIKQICYEEEGEDRFSEPEYSDYDYYEPPKKSNLSKMKSSYTVESFIDIDKRPPADLGGKFGPQPVGRTGKPGSAPSSGSGKSQNVAAGTPSMSSSTSSGYGSQAVSCSNLTNDDTYSIRSLSVGESPETMSPSNMRNEHTPPNAAGKPSDYYSSTGAAESHFNASAVSTEFPKRINPFLKNLASFDEMNGNRGGEPLDDQHMPLFNNNAKRSSEPAILSQSARMIDEEEEDNREREEESGVADEQRAAEPEEELTVSAVSHEDIVDEENNSSRMMSDSDVMENSFSAPSKHDNIPDWVLVGESVQIRPYNTSGVIAFIGDTHFQGGTWIGVELDTPTGKNDGTVQGIQYFSCKPKHGIFVRVDKLILDKRGRAMRELKKAEKMKAELANQKGKPVSATGPRK